MRNLSPLLRNLRARASSALLQLPRWMRRAGYNTAAALLGSGRAGLTVLGSTLRSFLNAFAIVVGIAAAVLMLQRLTTFYHDNTRPALIARDISGQSYTLYKGAPLILRLDIHGPIGSGHLQRQKIEALLAKSLRAPFSAHHLQGIILHVDTPGGTFIDTDAIYRMLLEYKKKLNIPLFAFIDGCCTSGGLYITAAADRIYATPNSIVGSVGACMPPLFNYSQALQRLGIHPLVLTAGKGKGALSPFRPWQEEECKRVQEQLDACYDRFLDVLTRGRTRLDRQKLVDVYGAQTFTAAKGQEYGFIDVGDASYRQMVKDLLRDRPLTAAMARIVHLQPRQSSAERLQQAVAAILPWGLANQRTALLYLQ